MPHNYDLVELSLEGSRRSPQGMFRAKSKMEDPSQEPGTAMTKKSPNELQHSSQYVVSDETFKQGANARDFIEEKSQDEFEDGDQPRQPGMFDEAQPLPPAAFAAHQYANKNGPMINSNNMIMIIKSLNI